MIDQYIRRYGRRLYGLCLYLCTSRADADDLYQETWLKALQNLDRYDREKDFEPWLTAICVNTWKNVLRRLKRSPVYDRFASAEEKEAALSAVPAKEREDYSDLHEALRKLPKKLRAAIVLCYFEDMDIRTTARILGVPEGTVKSRLNQARKQLKGVLADEGR